MLRSWNLKLQLNRTSGTALYLQIAQKIIDEIQQGRLPPTTVMPGTRDLADSLSVNRKTVVLTYDELIAQGWLVTEHRRGTFVSSTLPSSSSITNDHSPDLVEITPQNLSHAEQLQANQVNHESDIIDFTEGMPDSRLIPFEVLSRAFRRALVIGVRNNQLRYENSKGKIDLRNSIATMLNMARGLHIDADNICLVRGSQMGIFVAARVLTKPNDYVAFENLSYTSARDAFKSCGARILNVEIDRYGIKVDELERLCKLHPIRAVFVTPQHQYPTSAIMSASRRKELLRLANIYDFKILEDDHDHEFHFTDNPAFPLASDDRSDRVIYIGSLSKILAPGLRIGYLVASPAFADKCAADVMLIDR
ncbi:MAG TPA: PLP-dependent aminotransferase family protein [Methylophilaceae bacterium]|jgi:GntR family transcriptional regulator/MocR family aminotransferase